MSGWTWDGLERVTRAMAVLLLKQGTPTEAAPLPESCEESLDRWVRAYQRSSRPEFVFPTDPLQRRGLLARARYATAFAMQARLCLFPLCSKAGARVDLEALLVDHWHASAKTRWLSGEQGIALVEN